MTASIQAISNSSVGLLSTANPAGPVETKDRDDIFLLTKQQLVLAREVQGPMGYVFVAIMVPLALCNVIIFSRKGMRSASGTYVIAMNVGQLSFVVLTTITDAWRHVSQDEYADWGFCQFVFYVNLLCGSYVGNRGSYIILCLATFERLYAVVRPLHVKSFALSRYPLYCVGLVYALVALMHTPNIIVRRIIYVTRQSTGREVCTFVFTKLYNENKELFVSWEVAQKVIFVYTTLAIQLTVNVLIALALRRHNTANKLMTSSADQNTKRRQEQQLIKALLGAAICHVIFTVPSGVFNVFVSVFQNFRPFHKYENIYFVTLDLVSNLAVLDCGVDFFCFLAMSRSFRQNLLALFGFSITVKGKQQSTSNFQTASQTPQEELPSTSGYM